MAGIRFYAVLAAALLLGTTVSSAQPVRQRTAAVPPPATPAAGPNAPAPERPNGDMRIAAVVNDEVISVYDLGERMRMVTASSNIQDNPETRKRIAGQVLRSLIDEKLQLQEARKQNVSASDQEMKNALAQLEKQNNMRPGQLDEFLKARGIDRNALETQLTASIVWAKLVRRMATQTMELADDDIDDTLKRMREHANEPQSRIGEIFLAVDNPSQEDEVRRLAERLSEQMKQGARFSAVAQQFSQSATAAVGGDIGWVRPDQLAPELAKAATTMKPGELSPPIRVSGGYYLLLVIDRRNGNTGGEQATTYDIVQVVFPFPAQANEAAKRAAFSEVQAVRSASKDCPSMLKIGKEKAPQLSSEGKVSSDRISPELRSLISKLAIGEPSQPIVQKNGVGVIMVCSKDAGGKPGEITREEAGESLLRQRLDTLARRYMRDLRRNSYVDVRV